MLGCVNGGLGKLLWCLVLWALPRGMLLVIEPTEMATTVFLLALLLTIWIYLGQVLLFFWVSVSSSIKWGSCSAPQNYTMEKESGLWQPSIQQVLHTYPGPGNADAWFPLALLFWEHLCLMFVAPAFLFGGIMCLLVPFQMQLGWSRRVLWSSCLQGCCLGKFVPQVSSGKGWISGAMKGDAVSFYYQWTAMEMSHPISQLTCGSVYGA